MGIACMEYLGKRYKQESNETNKEKTSNEKSEKETSKEV